MVLEDMLNVQKPLAINFWQSSTELMKKISRQNILWIRVNFFLLYFEIKMQILHTCTKIPFFFLWILRSPYFKRNKIIAGIRKHGQSFDDIFLTPTHTEWATQQIMVISSKYKYDCLSFTCQFNLTCFLDTFLPDNIITLPWNTWEFIF